MTIQNSLLVTGAAQENNSSVPSSSVHSGLRARRLGQLLMLGLVLMASGCVTDQPWLGGHQDAPIPAQVVTFWDARIHEAQDVVNAGRPLPGLAGRLYLMNSEFRAQKGDGGLSVDMYDISHVQSGAPPERLESWELSQTDLAKLLRQDNKLGWGYTIFLPWPSVRPEVTRVELRACYKPAKGGAIYAQPAPISIINEKAPASLWRNQISSTQTQKTN